MGALHPIQDVAPDVVEEGGQAGILGVGNSHDRRQRVVVHVDQLQGILGDVTALGHHDRHQITDEAHPVGGHGQVPGAAEVGELWHDLDGQRHRLDVRARQDGGHPPKPCGVGDVYPVDPGVGERTAEKGRVEHPGEADVVDVPAAAGEDAPVLHPGDALAHESLRH